MTVLGRGRLCAYVIYMLQAKETVLYIAAFYFLINSLGKHKHMTSGQLIYSKIWCIQLFYQFVVIKGLLCPNYP